MGTLKEVSIRRFWRRLLPVGICLLVMGAYLTYHTALAELSREKYEPLAELSYKKLSDNMIVTGDVSMVIGKYTFDFGNGKNTYFVTALPTTENADSPKYISVNPRPLSTGGGPYRWWELRVEQWTEYLENGIDPPKGTGGIVQGKLHKTSEDSLTEAYKACGSYVSQGDILPYYAEPYSIDYRAQAGKVPTYPIGVGIALLVLGAGMIVGWIIHLVKTKNPF